MHFTKRIVLLIIPLLVLTISFFIVNNKNIVFIKKEKVFSNNEISDVWYNDFNYELNGNYIILTSAKEINDTNYELPGSATIDNVKYITKINRGSIFSNTSIIDLKIDDGVIIEGNIVPFLNSNIKNLDLSNMDLSNRENLYFLNGQSYENLNLSGSNLSNVVHFYLGTEVFRNANKVDFSNTNFEKLVAIEFSNHKIKNLDFSYSNLKSITFSSGFIGSGEFTNVTFHGAKLESFVYSNRRLLYGSLIENLDMSEIYVPNLVSLSGNFSNSPNIKRIDLSNIKAPKLETMSSVFENDTELTEVIFDGFEAFGLSDAAYSLFNNCPKLKKVKIEGLNKIMNNITPYMEELTIKNVNIIGDYFSNQCRLINGQTCVLNSVTIDNVDTIEKNAFAEINTLENITIKGNPTIEQYAFYYKATNYVNPWLGYSQNQLINNSRDFMPELKVTKLVYDDPNVLLYNWKKDSRFISDFKEHNIVYYDNYKNGNTYKDKFTAGDHINRSNNRDNYMFRGWNTKKDGSGKLYVLGEQILSNHDIVLYAQWLKNVFDSDDHKSGWLGESVKWRIDSDTSTLYIYPEGNSDGVMYDQIDQDSISLSVPHEILDANNIVFEEGITYIGRNIFKGGTSKKKVKFPSTLKKIGEAAFFVNIEEVENLDYSKVIFEDGVFSSSAKLEIINNGSSSWSTSNPVEYELTVDANGGKFNDNSTTKDYEFNLGYYEYRYVSANHEYSNNMKNPIEIEIPHKDGYVFKYLNTKSDGKGKIVEVKDNKLVIEVPTKVKLYAIYQKDKIKITYSTGDIPFSVDYEELYYGDRLTNEHPNKDGYVFAEWNTKPDGSGKGYYPNQIFKDKDDLKLYPIFRKTQDLVDDNNYSYGGSYKMATLEDGRKIKVFRAGHSYNNNLNNYYEVSKEYLTQFEEYIHLTDYDHSFNKLIAYLSTITEYNEGGFFDNLYTPDRFYDFSYDMPTQLTERCLDVRYYTSNNGNEKYIHELRFLYILKYNEYLGKKYELKVFTNGYSIFTGIVPIKSKVTIKAYDEDTKEPLTGLVLGLYDNNGELIDTFTIEDKDIIIELPVDEDYVLERLVLPKGYTNNKPIHFNISVDDLNKVVIVTDKKRKDIIRDIIINPKTGMPNPIILILIVISSIIYLLYRKKYKNEY